MAEIIKVGLSRRGLPEAVNFPFCLAPMVGLSHFALRACVRSYLPKGAITLWPSEMLNSRRVPYENPSKVPELLKAEDETVWVPQILGNEEEFVAPTVEKLALQGAGAIDINMGCPVKKALRHNYGVALMGDRNYAAEVVRMTVRNTHLPVSVKLRVGGEAENFYDFIEAIVQAGASWLAFHPRTTEQKRRGKADWSQIKELVRRTNLPIVGNGDVQTAEDALSMIEQTGVDMVMIGRALTARPWLFWQIGERLGWAPPVGREDQVAPATPEEEGREYGICLLKILKPLAEALPEKLALRKFNFHVRMSSPWLVYGQSLMSEVALNKEVAAVEEAIYRFFEKPQPMVQKTELRL